MGDLAKTYLHPKATIEASKGPFGKSDLDVVVGTKRIIKGEMGPGGEKGLLSEYTDKKWAEEEAKEDERRKDVNAYYDRMKSLGYEYTGNPYGRPLLSNTATVGTRKK